MRFSELLTSAGIDSTLHGEDVEIASVVSDSRQVVVGCCFVAVRGLGFDGHDYIPAAIAAGASAVVCETDIVLEKDFTRVIVSDSRRCVSLLAQAISGWPSRKLKIIAITGTNGKTTVAHLIREILTCADKKPGLIGTIEYDTGDKHLSSSATTPDGITLAKMMSQMVKNGLSHLVMETSSHALDQSRVAGIDFAVGVFTNLSGDHLDYHETFEKYRDAKSKLFSQLGSNAAAVINRDDNEGDFIADTCQCPVTWFGLNMLSDVRAQIKQIDACGSNLLITTPSGQVDIQLPLIGRHNVYNVLSAIASCQALGVDLATCQKALNNLSVVPGRLQRIDVIAPFDVFVDYAHTDDALANVLSSLRPVTKGRLIVIFGCGGNRDRTKRPRMAKVANDLADVLIITSDNPRNEDPTMIIDEMLQGLDASSRDAAIVQADRAKAIKIGISVAIAGDVVLVAGKGHERYQIIGDERIAFDDVEQTRKAMNDKQ